MDLLVSFSFYFTVSRIESHPWLCVLYCKDVVLSFPWIIKFLPDFGGNRYALLAPRSTSSTPLLCLLVKAPMSPDPKVKPRPFKRHPNPDSLWVSDSVHSTPVGIHLNLDRVTSATECWWEYLSYSRRGGAWSWDWWSEFLPVGASPSAFLSSCPWWRHGERTPGVVYMPSYMGL